MGQPSWQLCGEGGRRIRYGKYHTNRLPRSELERIIDEWCIGFSHCKRNAAIYKSFVLDGETVETIAERHELSPRQTVRIIADVATMLEGKTS